MTLHLLQLIYYLLIITGASLVLGGGISRLLFNNCLTGFYRLLSGFALLPVVVVYIAYTGLTRVPLLVEITGLCLAVAGIVLLYRFGGQLRVWLADPALYLWLIVPLFSLGYLLSAKACYLTGGLNNFDDLRSVALTGSFATNYLKPAFLFDFSIPISYSFYLYEWSALLYAAVQGIGMPSVPVLAVNLFVVGLFYAALAQLIRALADNPGPLAFLLVSALVTYYGFDFTMEPIWQRQHLEWWNSTQITQTASYFHWTYQYLFSGTLILLGLINLSRFIRSGDRHSALLFVLLHSAAAGYGAITFVWATLSLLMLLFVHLLGRQRMRLLKYLLPQLLPALLIALLVVLPTFPAFVGRDVIISFPIPPHFWYSFPEAGLIAQFWLNLKQLFIEVGPMILLGLISIPFWFRHADGDAAQVRRELALFASGLLLLSILSSSGHFDWFSRGLLLLVIIAALFAAELLLPWLTGQHRQLMIPLFVLMMIPQLFNFMLENQFRLQQCTPGSPMALKMNANHPLGTLFFSDEPVDLKTIQLAGRAFLGPQTGNYLITYLNRPDFLREWFAWEGSYQPCQSTPYGSNTPDGSYLQPVGGELREMRCPTNE